MANFLHEKYADVRFDAVVMIGVAGVPFLLKYRDIIAPGVPVVLSDITQATFDRMRLPPDITAVIVDYDPAKTLELAEHLQPGARRLVVIAGNNSDDRRWQEAGRKAVEAHNNPKLETSYWFDRSYNSLLEDVSRLPDNTIVLFLTFFADSEDKPLIPKMWLRHLQKLPPLRSMASSKHIWDRYRWGIYQHLSVDRDNRRGSRAGDSFREGRNHSAPADRFNGRFSC